MTLYTATVYLPFTYAARDRARDSKPWGRLNPQEWNRAAVQAQKPQHREFLEQYGCRSMQIDAEDGMVRFEIGSGLIDQETADLFCEVFDGCRGRLEEFDRSALVR